MFSSLARSGCHGSVRSIATVISGKKTAETIKEKLKQEVKKMETRPRLVVLQVGDRMDSDLYVGSKLQAASQIGIKAERIRLSRTTTQNQLLDLILSVNQDPEVHALIIQLPLDSLNQIDTNRVTDAVSPEKDVDGLGSVHAGRLSRGNLRDCFVPCTPNGCMMLIRETGLAVARKHAVVIGRSKIVGAPMRDLLLWSDATVTSCHSQTTDLPDQVKRADILVVGVGRAQMVKGEWLKEGAVVIDCGINYITGEAGGRKLVGDVHFASAYQRAAFITPVPGGVGPMTVAMLMQNTVQSAKRILNPAHRSDRT